MRDPGERPLSLQEWVVLCIACEKPTYGFAIAGLLSREGSLGQVWQVSKRAVYSALPRLEQRGLVQATGQEPTSVGPARSLVQANPARPQGGQDVAAHTRGAWP
jgi:DNA-binding PadR family transcriptional regulator